MCFIPMTLTARKYATSQALLRVKQSYIQISFKGIGDLQKLALVPGGISFVSAAITATLKIKMLFPKLMYLQGRTQDFLKGGGRFFSCIMASRVRKINFT